jgi:hypothetical protein
MRPFDFERYDILLQLNQLNGLAEELHANLVTASDWLFIASEVNGTDPRACIQTASKCATAAREILKALEVQIQKTEMTTARMKPRRSG